MPGLDWIRFYVVSICCIKNDDVAVASVGGDRESPSLIAVELAFDLCNGHVHVVCFVIARSLWH